MMHKFKVIRLSGIDKSLGLREGDLISVPESQLKKTIKLCVLPKRLQGKGHGERGIYWCFHEGDLREVRGYGSDTL